MSDLKHQTLPSLRLAHKECEHYIRYLKNRLSGQEERIKWINYYITKKENTDGKVDQAN